MSTISKNTPTSTPRHLLCDSHGHAGENVSLFVKQTSLTESISRQGEQRILDSIKLTAFLVGALLTGAIIQPECVFERKKEDKCKKSVYLCICVCARVDKSVRLSVFILRMNSLVSVHPHAAELCQGFIPPQILRK